MMKPDLTIDEMISVMERLQTIYDRIIDDDQKETKRYVRWAIQDLAHKVWSACS